MAPRLSIHSMEFVMKTWSLLLSLFFVLTSVARADIPMADIDAMLKGNGLKGEIHGASTDGKLLSLLTEIQPTFLKMFNCLLPLKIQQSWTL